MGMDRLSAQFQVALAPSFEQPTYTPATSLAQGADAAASEDEESSEAADAEDEAVENGLKPFDEGGRRPIDVIRSIQDFIRTLILSMPTWGSARNQLNQNFLLIATRGVGHWRRGAVSWLAH